MNKKKYLPNSWESMGKTYYVAQNNPQASDSNQGTQKKPFKTISKVATIMDMGDTARIDEGAYREEVKIYKNGHIYQPRLLPSFKAVSGKRVYLKGSDIFETEWEHIENNVYKAQLPEWLFKEDVYNPYELSIVIDEPRRVRPTEENLLPETLGQIYLDGEAYEQVSGSEELLKTIHSFVVSGNGKEIIIHCDANKSPKDCLVELTVRQRCFKPQFAGKLFIQTMGMVIEHAAEPGAFSYCRPLSIRKNPSAGILVRKTFNIPGTSERDCGLLGGISYISKDKPTLIASIVDDTLPCTPEKTPVYNSMSEDSGKTWKITGTVSTSDKRSGFSYFFDEENGMLVRWYLRYPQGIDLNGISGKKKHEVILQVSHDEGKTWSKPNKIHYGKNYYFGMIKLHDGTLLWLYTENQQKEEHHSCMKSLVGEWNKNLSSIDWQEGGMLEIDPLNSSGGLAEPHACQFRDGRIFVVLRQGNILASQHHPGSPSVKLFSISEDNGMSWSEPKPLTYEDGEYIYSPRSWQDTFCSSKNGKPYVILNISNHSTHNCDPRTSVQIVEVDRDSLFVRRNSVAIIETKHEEHQRNVRFSNWQSIEDRQNGNLLLFMKLHTSQQGPVHSGYDCNLYRYEIILPD